MPFGSKTDGRQVTVGGKKYTYSATEGAWLRSGVIDSTVVNISELNISGNLEADSLTIGGQDWNANRAAAETSIENTKTAAETYINNAASTAETNLAAQITQHDADVAAAIAGVITDVVGDLTPQLGGNLDGNQKNVTNVPYLELYKDVEGDYSFARLNRRGGGDLSHERSFIEFVFTDDNANNYPQVKIGAEVGVYDAPNDADSTLKEGSGAFIVYTNHATDANANTTSGMAERLRVSSTGVLYCKGPQINLPTLTSDPTTEVQAGTCYFNTAETALKVYDGEDWGSVTFAPLGSSEQNPAPSAQAIMDAGAANGDGWYWIDCGSVGAKQIYCIMDTNISGGGWMLGMKADTGNTFNFDSGYWTNTTLLNDTDYSRNSGNSKYAVFSHYAATDWLAVWPSLGNGGCVSSGYGGWTWVLNGATGQAEAVTSAFARGYSRTITNSPQSGCWWNGSYWSAQGGYQGYHVNYTTNSSNKVRWGFAWNNEGDQGSNDTSGGIGMNRRDASAGDYIGCCQTTNGINSSTRIEWYVR